MTHTPPCPHFGTCGGCQLQHLDPQAYGAHKEAALDALLKRFEITPDVRTPLIVVPPHTRRRATLHGVRKATDVTLGYYAAQTHDIVPITTCLVVRPEIERLLSPLHILLASLLKPKETVDCVCLVTDQGIDLTLSFKGPRPLQLQDIEMLTDFAKTANLTRLSIAEGGAPFPIVTFKESHVMFDHVPVTVTADAFLQASVEGEHAMLAAITQALPQSLNRIADLFCGRGTFSLPLSHRAPVDAFDMDGDALQSLSAALRRHKRAVTPKARNLFKEPLTVAELEPYDCVVCDPPRVGALQQARALAASAVPHIVMISCKPATFTQDAKALIQGGYRCAALTPIDQFTWSNHLEIVAHFTR